MNIYDCKILNLPKIGDKRGNLSFVEEMAHIPFAVERTYWIYDVPGGESRGGHAYKENEEFIIALSGSFDDISCKSFFSCSSSIEKPGSILTLEKSVFKISVFF